MITRLDHVVIAVRDLEEAMRRYRALGFDVRPGGKHTGLGTYNALIRFGLDYLELIAVYDEAEARANGRDGILDFLEDREGGLARFALASIDLDEDAARWRGTGLAAVGPYAMERERPDGTVLSWRLLVPSTPGWRTALPFLIQWDQPDDERLRVEGIGEHANGAVRVSRVGLVTTGVAGRSEVFARSMGLFATASSAGSVTFRAGNFRIEIAEAEASPEGREVFAEMGEGLLEIEIAVRDLEATRRLLADAGVEAEEVEGRVAVRVSGEAAMGARLVFVPGV
jgi:hypothetical protein